MRKKCKSDTNFLFFLHLGYGMTETSPLLTMARSDGTSPHGSVGILCPNTECVIVDMETGESQPSNKVGEFWARGPQNMKGERDYKVKVQVGV